MSKITEIKKQYPELNISIIDLFLKMDSTKTNKYLPLMCKLLSSRFQVNKLWNKRDEESEMNHMKERMDHMGLNYNDMSNNELYSYYCLADYFNHEDMKLLSSFQKYNERGLIPNKDVTSYQNFEQIMASVGLASLKEDEKELRSQIVREHDDETWLALRPLTFGASSKYGAATKWCTTYQNDKQYFERYWKRGILVYFINKITGLKFAVFKALDGDKELSFWNAADQRVDFLELDIDDYMFPIIKQILKSEETNRDLSSTKIRTQVRKECGRSMEKSLVQEDRYEEVERPMYEVETPMMEEAIPQINFNMEERRVEPRVVQLRPLGREIREEMNNIMEEIGEDMTEETISPLRRRISNLRESMGIRLQNIEIGGAHQVGEEIGYEEDCTQSPE
jgi:hypothetical protein